MEGSFRLKLNSKLKILKPLPRKGENKASANLKSSTDSASSCKYSLNEVHLSLNAATTKLARLQI